MTNATSLIRRLLPSMALGLAVLVMPLTVAAQPASPVQTEVHLLLERLSASGCRFNRNGSWHDGRKASDHLARKLAYIARRGTLESTEQFIELAASRSSASGKPYLVQCGQDIPVASAAWLASKLKALRAQEMPAGLK